ncbi:c-type cytochrome [Halarcobacter anaerophilus]|uniref:c-type cytochrome n=1 Tax=Halarcobacter anaerophilus TaxID=877500 RepID=UPI0005CB7A84|nr:cytochrome c [Halarcobacter anaerophilus]
MRLLTTVTLSSIATLSIAFAQTTMCFKENHKSMATIETTPLDGGACGSTKSVQDMKKDGWSIDDINIQKTNSGTNYIYIFKKDMPQQASSISEEKLEQRILQRLEERKKVEIEVKKEQARQRMSRSGKKLYIDKCQSCHGEKADEEYGTSRALIALDLEEFQTTLRDYMLGEYDRGQAFRMIPYANIMDSGDIKNVYSYIQALKDEKKENHKKQEESK